MLRDSTSPQKIVHQNLWQSVTPGSRLFMSIEVPQETEKTTKCRRSGCGGMLESNQEHLKCQACGFECFLLTNSSTSDVEPVQSTAYGPSSKNLHALEGGVFSTEFRHVYQLIGPTGTKPPGVQRLEEAFEEQSSFALGSYVRHLFWSGWLNLTMPGNPSNVPSDVITTIPSTTRTCLDILQECESRGDLYFPRSHDRHSSWKCVSHP